MKLPIPFLNAKADDSAYYLALVLTDEKASAVILHENLGKIKIINSREEILPSSVEMLSLEDLITVVDKAISRAEEVLPPNIETHKTVFGVKENWVDPETKKIKKEYLSKLKKVCDNLDLTPIGFMVTSEALANLLQQEEGAPLSAILAEIGQESVTLTLLRGGKPIETIQGPFTESAPHTVDTLLRHFTTAVLPARIIVFSIKANERLSHQFTTHHWSKALPFTHIPHVTILPTGFDARAVTFGAASQLGFELLTTSQTAMVHPVPTVSHAQPEEEEEAYEPQLLHTDVDETEEEENASPLPHEKTISAAETAPPIQEGDNFGFVAGHDIATSPPPERTTMPEPSHTSTKTPHPFHAEHATHRESKTHHASHTEQPSLHHEAAVHHTHHTLHQETETPRHKSPSKKEALLAALPSFSLPKFNVGSSALAKNKLLWIGVASVFLLILLGLGVSYYYYNNVTTSVMLTLKPKMANQTTSVTFSATSPSDFSKDIIAAKSITTSLNGELSMDVTGKKDVGEKAKGKVTIYNNSLDSETLSSGTIIKASNGQQFLLDKDVSVASAAGDIFSGTKPGTTDVAVTAKEFGTEYNLPSNTKFAIGNNNLLAAKNDSAFSGGSKKSVTVVSKEDMAKLRTELPKTLEDQAIEALGKETESGETVLPALLSTTLTKEKFDKKIGDETKKLKLNATVEFGGLAYTNDDLEQYTKSLLKKDDEENVSVADNTIKNSVEDAKKKSAKEIEATIALEAGLLPNIDTAEVTRDLEGKSLGEAQEILARLPQLETSNISFSPSIPLLPNLFPTLPKTITVQVTSNE